MPLVTQADVNLGHYEVPSSLGAGGVGEVCRARDTKLGREEIRALYGRCPLAKGLGDDRLGNGWGGDMWAVVEAVSS